MISESTQGSDALLVSLLAKSSASQRALKAVQQVRELEWEVTLLREACVVARQDMAWKEKAACLLSKLILLRVAIAGGTTLGSRDNARYTWPE